MATHSSTLAWKIPWTEEPGRATVQGSQRVRHDFTFLTFLWSSLSTEQHLPLAAGLTSIHPSTKAVFLILFSCLCCVLLFCQISLRGLFFILCVTICRFPFCQGQFLELYQFPLLMLYLFVFLLSLISYIGICTLRHIQCTFRQRWIFTSQLSLGFQAYLLVMSLGKWGLLLC